MLQIETIALIQALGETNKSHYRVVAPLAAVSSALRSSTIWQRWVERYRLIERSVLTAGSSWHAAGGVHALNADPNISPLKPTPSISQPDRKGKRQSVGMHMTGGLTLAGTPIAGNGLQSAYRVYQSIGIEDVRLVTPEEAGEMCPVLSTHGILGGQGRIAKAMSTPPARCGLCRRGEEKRRHVIEYNRVLELNQTSEGWDVVTEKGTISCARRHAAGLWAKQVDAWPASNCRSAAGAPPSADRNDPRGGRA